MIFLPDKMELENYYYPFINKGVLFEHLVRDILSNLHPGKKFEFTAVTGDQGRDIESSAKLLVNTDVKEWVECKNLSSKLALSDISNTMFFAYLNNPAVLLIFSYTDLNPNFKLEVAEFAKKTNINISWFADNELEQLVLKYRNKLDLKTYFPNCDFSRIPVLAEIHDNTNCYGIVVSEENSIKDLPQEAKLNYNSIFFIKVYIENNCSNTKSYSITLENGYKNLFTILDKDWEKFLKKDITIPPHSIDFVKIPLRLNTADEEVVLPQIFVKDGKLSFPVFKDNRNIKTQWMCESPLVGQEYLGIVSLIESHMITHDLHLVAIEGKSGMGKSRLLKEMIFSSIKSSYKPYYRDLESSSSNLKYLCDSIISLYEGFPLYKEEVDIPPERLTLRKKNALKIFNKNFVHSEHIDYIAGYICELLKEEPCLIILDNVQNADNHTATLLGTLVEMLNGLQPKGMIIISINSDLLIEGTDIKGLRDNLKLICDQNPSMLFREIKGFQSDNNEAYVLLKNIIRLENEMNEHNAILKVISEKYEKNPFHLVESIKYLHQNNILKKRGNQLYITDWNLFVATVNNIPLRLSGLIDKRVNALKRNNDLKFCDDFKNLICLLNLAQRLPDELYYKMGFSQDMLNQLIEFNFVKIDGGNIVFFHQLIDRYFSGYSFYNEELLRRFIIAIDTLNLRNKVLYAYYKAKKFLGEINYELNSMAMKQGVHLIDISHLKLFAADVIDYTLNNYRQYRQEDLIEFFLQICSATTASLGEKAGLDNLSTLYNFIRENYNYFSRNPKLPSFIYKVICSYINLFELSSALRVCDEYINISLSGDISNYEKAAIESMIAERKFQAYLKLFNYNNASIQIENAYKAASKNKHIPQIIKALYGKGKLAYYSLDEKCAQYWHEAYELYYAEIQPTYNLNNYSHRDKQIMANIDGMLADIVCGISYETKRDVLLSWLDNSGMPYHEIKIRFALVVADLYNNECETSLSYIEEAKLKCLLHNFTDMYPKCFYLAAMVYYKQKKWQECLDNMHLAIKAYLKMGVKLISKRQPNFYYNLLNCIKNGNLSLNYELHNDLLGTDGEFIIKCVRNKADYDFNLPANAFFREIPFI